MNTHEHAHTKHIRARCLSQPRKRKHTFTRSRLTKATLVDVSMSGFALLMGLMLGDRQHCAVLYSTLCCSTKRHRVHDAAGIISGGGVAERRAGAAHRKNARDAWRCRPVRACERLPSHHLAHT
eukprot:1181930-Prorocentrum_minimum.AAC.3